MLTYQPVVVAFAQPDSAATALLIRWMRKDVYSKILHLQWRPWSVSTRQDVCAFFFLSLPIHLIYIEIFYSFLDVSSFYLKQNEVVAQISTTTPVAQSVIYSTEMCPLIETNVDYKGNDTDYRYSTSVENCCSVCSTTEGCTGFTFIR